jgi:peptidoglycan-N-acetylglucosamine deacetylase
VTAPMETIGHRASAPQHRVCVGRQSLGPEVAGLRRHGWIAGALGLAIALGATMGGRLAAQARAQPVYYIATDQKAVALTFDVSWGTIMLPKVLAELATAHQTATFFLSGPWAAAHPDLVAAIVGAGNELASHGQQHVNLSDQSTAAITENLRAADDILRGYSHGPLRFFRPPNGDFDGRVIQAAHALGYETIIWSVDSRDWMNPGVQTIVSRVTRQVFPGAVLLFHASDTCRQTDLALPIVITDLRAEGYHLVTLGQLWTMGPPRRDDPRGSGQRPNMAAPTSRIPGAPGT